ncbi:TraR/DksA family transcriptional regulator [Geoalkalibacter halelectricus]|uniref:TraR/DksA family transcriptional regulator n=1 Tax=Geoalkalibacter halelectricus TaxID=2847045 RepID=A0ABY5ZT29_9BACT|nr:TraR/DksA family transcriptional regulator [Geoalkalibacter halelectricus]MDO3376888.1 TraR/DksA family transcriptional regulator [Geoalkalibacter halelectricus]UWZ81112.1 TraR/DksA family transcriptional regulator [Geoalkalibacter halelectricus]
MRQTELSGYRPSEQEPYMNPRQLAFFRERLLRWRRILVHEDHLSLQRLRGEKDRNADPVDQGAQEAEQHFDFERRFRNQRLLAQIDAALVRIEEGTYGYCEESGEEIGLRRLEALPLARLSVEAQELIERGERFRRLNNLD